MLSEEYIGARRKLERAKELCPDLDNVDKMIIVCDMLILGDQMKLLSDLDIDWGYRVFHLFVPSSGTSSNAGVCYRKLVGSLEGIKDEFPGTESALKLTQDVFSRFLDQGHCYGIPTPGHKDNSQVKVDQEDASSECLGSSLGSASGQIWAVYDAENKVPRRYVQVNVPVDSEGLVHVVFLEPICDDFGCKKGNLPVSCGAFSLRKEGSVLGISEFSHPVEFKRYESELLIYPRKGEVWAMYKNWSKKWHLKDYEKSEYYAVEIVSEFSSGNGVKVCKLSKVGNFWTIFYKLQQDWFDMVRTFTLPEMFSFSHRIPAFRLSAGGAYGIPERSWYLEPNAIPVCSRNFKKIQFKGA